MISRCVKAATKISDFLSNLKDGFNPLFGSSFPTLKFKCIKGMHRTIKILFIFLVFDLDGICVSILGGK